MPSLKRPSLFLSVLISGPLVISVLILSKCLRPSSSDLGFEHYTGMRLPADIKAVAHKSEMTDNLFHTAHYWLLNGDVVAMRELATTFGLERSDEDAKFMLPDIQKVFDIDLGAGDIAEGYEGNPGGGRDRWLFISSEKKTAVFIF